jgi:superfamily II DNA or RNA helicase
MVETNVKFPVPTRRVWVDGIMTNKIDFTKLLGSLVTSKERNTSIVEKIVTSLQQGHKPLILSDRVEHCKHLYQHLKDLGYIVVLLIGETRKKTNWEEIRQDDSIQAIVAQRSIAEEGLDYPSLSAIHLTCPSSNLPKIKQRVGRIRRTAEDKLMPMVYDYVDNLVYMNDSRGNIVYPLKRGAKSRESFYKKLRAEYEQNSLI